MANAGFISVIKDLTTLDEKSNSSFEEIERSMIQPMQVMPAHPSQSTISFRKSNSDSFSPKKSGFRYQSPTKSSAMKQKNQKKEPQNNLYTSPTQQDDSLMTD